MVNVFRTLNNKHNCFQIIQLICACSSMGERSLKEIIEYSLAIIPLWGPEDWEGQLLEECPVRWQYRQTSCIILLCKFILRDLSFWGPENWEGQLLEECPVWWQWMQAPCLVLLRWTVPDTIGGPCPLAGEHIKIVIRLLGYRAWWHRKQQTKVILIIGKSVFPFLSLSQSLSQRKFPFFSFLFFQLGENVLVRSLCILVPLLT